MRHHRIVRRAVATAAAAAAALIVVGGPAAALIVAAGPAASATPRVIDVNGIISGFTPKTINVTAGEQVSICLTSPDTDHDLTIPTVDNFQVVAPVGPAVCKTLTAPTKTGSYEFICSIPGHVSAGMVGSLVVAAAGSAAPAATGGASPQAGPVPAGGAPTADRGVDLSDVSPLMLGGVLLIAAMMSALLGWRVAQKD